VIFLVAFARSHLALYDILNEDYWCCEICFCWIRFCWS